MKRCPKCSAQYPDGVSFCKADGTALEDCHAGPARPGGGSRKTSIITVTVLAVLFIAIVCTVTYLYVSDHLSNIPVLGNIFSSPLTMEKVANGEYSFESYGTKVRLKDGAYTSGPVTSDDFFRANMSHVALGDLNTDKTGDAAVVLVCGGSGSGSFYELFAVVSKGGTPNPVASVPMGDRTKVNSLSIENGEIVIDMIVHGPGDPACCPTIPKVNRYRLSGNRLILSGSSVGQPVATEGSAEPPTREETQPQAGGEQPPATTQGSIDIGRWSFTSTRSVTENDIRGLSKRDLELMRNEIYARHGRIFARKDLQSYFEAQSWYRRNPSFRDSDLSIIEMNNVNIIKRYE